MWKLFLALCLLFTISSRAQKTDAIADSLKFLLSIANNSFNELHPLHNGDWEKLPLHILQADETNLNDYGIQGYELWLTFLKTNPQAEERFKQIRKFMNRLEGNDGWSFLRLEKKDDSKLLYKGAPALEYILGDAPDKEYFYLRVYQTVQSMPPFADESSYDNNNPSPFKDSDNPQIRQITGKGNGADSYMRFNGVFTKSGLQAGKITIHGYGKFYEGTWISKNFHPLDKGRISAIFIPANTTDTVHGTLNDSSMRTFRPDTRYAGYYKNKYYHILPTAPSWINLCEAYCQAVHEQDERDKETAYKLKHPNETYNPSYNNTNPGKPDKIFMNVCSCCHGSKTVQQKSNSTYQVRDKYGNNQGTTSYINVTCPCCHGTGTQ